MPDYKKILIVQLYSNGDCLYATTLAKQAKHDYQNCTVQWLVFESVAPTLQNNPFIDEILILEKIPDEKTDVTYVRAKSFAEKHVQSGNADVYFFTQLLSDNFCNYDGCLRRSMYRFYPNPVTVDRRAILQPFETEIEKAKRFAQDKRLQEYESVILFETSPLSGQAKLTDDDIRTIAASLADLKSTCVIISSFKSFRINHPHVFDGSVLSIRETVALSHFCTLVLGCSSGISWGSLTTGGKILPMVQVLDPDTYIYNPPSLDFTVSGYDIKNVIELFIFTPQTVTNVISDIITKDFQQARQQYNQVIKNKYMLHRGIVHDFLKRKKFWLLLRFIRINLQQNGLNKNMIIKMAAGFFFLSCSICDESEKKQNLSKCCSFFVYGNNIEEIS